MISCNGTFENVRSEGHYSFPKLEPQWIRDGNPIIFEEEAWYPQDDIDVFLDDEVYPLGEYQGVEFFIDKADVRPYDRLYTKFAENKFRVYEKKRHD
jgi:hypothetical protein